MPQRSNTFQRLVAELQAELAPGWTVRESRMLEDAVTGGEREVDVVLESRVAGTTLLIGVECRDHSRPADVTWVEAMATKHQHLPTNKLVLWSASGFYEPAIAKATFLKIDTVSQRDALDTPWKSIARDLLNGFVRVLRPSFEFVVDVRKPDGSGQRFENKPHFLLQSATATPVALQAVLDALKDCPEMPKVLLDHAPEGAGDFFAVYEPPLPSELVDNGTSLGLVSRIIMSIRTQVELGAIDSSSINHDNQLRTLAQIDLPSGTFEVRLKEREGRAPLVDAKYRSKSATGKQAG